jgi:two-component system cell cycle sensor histidine kinase/response regulator CckA
LEAIPTSTSPSGLQDTEVRLHWATLEYAHQDTRHLEESFQERYFQQNLRHLRYCHFFTLFFYLLSSSVDWLLFPDDLPLLLSIRFSTVIPVFILGYFFTYSPVYQKFWQQISACYILLAGGSFVLFAMIAEAPAAYGYYAGILICLIFGYTFIRERFVYAATAGTLLSCTYLLVSAVVMEMPFAMLFQSNLYLFTANFLGMLVARHIEISARQDFYLKHRYAALNDALEGHVEERTRKLKKEIAERKQAEKVMEESERRFRELFQNNPACCFTFDREGTVLDWNRACEKLYGWKMQEAVGKSMFDLMVQEKNKLQTQVNLERLFEGASLEGLEFEDVKADGTLCHLLVSEYPVYDNRGKVVYGLCAELDITDRKRAEEALRKSEEKYRRAQKMEALGVMAGGVAHDINNVLSGIVSYPDLLLLQLPEDSPLRKPVLTIQESGKKAADIVQDLLTLARRGVVVEDVVYLNDIVSEYLENPECRKLLSFHPQVEIVTKLDPELLPIVGSRIHLCKTVMNLVSNAAEAMPQGGRVVVTTQNRYCEKTGEGDTVLPEGDYVILKVADDGIGIGPEEKERIFEPFYTKKVMGRSGTGLGMAVVWGTVQDHNGTIDVDSTLGKGTVFTLRFPATRQTAAARTETPPLEAYLGNGESILVVDDVREQREISHSLLTTLGYRVDVVSSGEQAVEFLMKREVDLVVLDMIMDPGIDGLETYRRMIKARPGQKAVIASGFSETKRVAEAQALGAGRYIKKPYTLEKLGAVVKAELDA